jgi:hypothetical protein
MVVKYLLGGLLGTMLAFSAAAQVKSLTFCGNAKSDLFIMLKKNSFTLNRYDSPEKAIEGAPKGSGVIIVSDDYPTRKTHISSSSIKKAARKKLRLYIEYPGSLPGLNIQDTIIENRIDRGIIVSNDFGNDLKPMSILGINDCHILPVEVDSPLIVLGRVAGFDKAVYGISDVKTYPVLFKHGDNIVAMTKLSNFATGRYEPQTSWKEVWEYVLAYLTGVKNLHLRHWLSYVSPMYGKSADLPDNAKRISVNKGTQWFYNAHLFVDPSWEKMQLKYQGNGSSPVGPPVSRELANGNGSLGILEGPASRIDYDGTQQYRYWIRADVQGEVAYALSAAADLLDKPYYDTVAANLIDFVLYHSNLRAGKKKDKKSSVYGLVGWAVTHPGTFYGDDNARCMLGMIGASAYLHTDRWDKEILENILANFRTTGVKGFRGNRLEESAILKNGWQYYWNRDIVSPHPHFESWLWACYLWLYDKTGYQPLLEKTEKAIKITMENYPSNWLWTNGLQQERARMILPLAWLVRVDNTREHRKWLEQLVTDLISFQAPSGAIREELGTVGKGQAGPARSNSDYSTHEEPLIFKNGQPVADMLYTCNFALFSLNEAAHATNNPKWKQAANRLSDFLTRIQVKSNKFSDINGAWFRAFDYSQWDYWASNGDAGWGAWATLTGWIQSWIVSTQVLVERRQDYWDLTRHSSIDKYMNSTVRLMFKDEAKESK